MVHWLSRGAAATAWAAVAKSNRDDLDAGTARRRLLRMWLLQDSVRGWESGVRDSL
jgi:hypothetical protein